ncbi:MAG: YbaK/EbsC family protein, partial [Pseudomonadota bacterium]
MAVKGKIPATPAVRFLKAAGIDFTPRQYNYEDRGGTETAARELGVDEHGVIKTLVFEDETGGPCLVLMHGDRQVSTKSLARNLGAKTVSTCDPA